MKLILDDVCDKSVKRLFQCIILQAMKDYRNEGYLIRKDIYAWVDNMNGTFDLCADALNLLPENLRDLMLTKFRAMDKGEDLHKYRSVYR